MPNIYLYSALQHGIDVLCEQSMFSSYLCCRSFRVRIVNVYGELCPSIPLPNLLAPMLSSVFVCVSKSSSLES